MRRALILSDLHLCPPGTHPLFTEDEALAAFIEAQIEGQPTELVLAGDVFDFLMGVDYAGFDAGRAVDRLHAILDHHPRVIEALRGFVGSGRHRVTLLSGNHDPEVALPAVHAAFAKAIDAPSVGAAECLRPRGDAGPAVYGRALGDPDRPIWVVHGDRWDDHNHIDIDALRAAAVDGMPFELPAGSHLVMALIRPLVNAGGHGWAPHLKPEIEMVLGLLLYLDPQRVMAFLGAHFDLTVRLVWGRIRRWIGRSDLLGSGAEAQGGDPLATVWADVAAGLDPARAERDLAVLEGALRDGWPPSTPGALAGHDGVKKALLRVWLRRARAGDSTLAIDAEDEVSRHASARLPGHVAALIAGHTHGPRARRDHAPPYFNSGTWAATGPLPEGDLEDLIDRLERGELPLPASPRSYVEVTGPDPKDIALRACKPQ